MKRQFDKKLFFLIVIISVAIGIAVWNVFEEIQGYATHIALGFFAISTMTYSLILGHLDKTKPIENTPQKEQKAKSYKTPTYSLFLTQEEVQAAKEQSTDENLPNQPPSALQE